MRTPRVSILMGIYNCADTMGEAIESIQAQDYSDWEFVICDDGSSDGSLALARKFSERDPRIRVIANSSNLGLGQTLDHCASVARGEYLARMDGDDVSVPRRLRKLVAALDENPGVAVVSSWTERFDEHGPWGIARSKAWPSAADLYHGTPVCHAACMMRRSAFEAAGGYGDKPWAKRVEDYYLWFRFYAAGFRAMNLEEVLYRVRDDRAATMRRNFRARLNETIVRWKGFALLGYPAWRRVWAIRPLAVWLLPEWVYRRARRRQIRD